MAREPSKAERELRAYSDEFLIRQHAERFAMELGPQRAVAILEEVRDSIAQQIPVWIAR